MQLMKFSCCASYNTFSDYRPCAVCRLQFNRVRDHVSAHFFAPCLTLSSVAAVFKMTVHAEPDLGLGMCPAVTAGSHCCLIE